MRATSKPRSALDEEIGPSDLDLLNLTDYQGLLPLLSFLKSWLNSTLPKTGECSLLLRWKRPERIMGFECEAALLDLSGNL